MFRLSHFVAIDHNHFVCVWANKDSLLNSDLYFKKLREEKENCCFIFTHIFTEFSVSSLESGRVEVRGMIFLFFTPGK